MVLQLSSFSILTVSIILTQIFICISGSALDVAETIKSQSVFEIKLIKLSEKSFCCQKNVNKSDDNCACDQVYRICLTHYQEKVDANINCTFGEIFKTQENSIRQFQINFPFQYKWPGDFSLIVDIYAPTHESNAGHFTTVPIHKRLLSRTTLHRKLEAGLLWTEAESSDVDITTFEEPFASRLKFRFRLRCTTHYYGKSCDTLCRPRNDLFGHFSCGLEGQKICLPGWMRDPTNLIEDYCSKPICAPGCNREHGTCDRPGECKCKFGWEGRNCDQCIKYPGCEHGTCIEPNQCNCDEGWGGLFCKKDLNYCTNHRPCFNNATCFNVGQAYKCDCLPGYTGKHCEDRLKNECSHQPCLNGGTCQESETSDYMCVCPRGFQGSNCELPAQSCSHVPCQNGAECINIEFNGNIGYECKCRNGFIGVNCDIEVDHCFTTTPCENGGTCHRHVGRLGGSDYSCDCPPGFDGMNCEKNIDDCKNNPCQNGGSCTDFTAYYKCNCPAGFYGPHCENNYDECITQPCQNGGTCHDLVNDFVCTCASGYYGKDCSMQIDFCDPKPCKNGFCISNFNDFSCKCIPNYMGKRCDILASYSKTQLKEDGTQGTNNALIGTFSVLVPLLILVLIFLVLCNRRVNRQAQFKRAEKLANRENELNAVNCVNVSKKLDDHMIVNTLEYPKQKCINTNPNIADEEIFNAKDSAYAQMLNKTKQLNSIMSYHQKDCDNKSCISSASSSISSSSSVSAGALHKKMKELGTSSSNFVKESNNCLPPIGNVVSVCSR